MGILKLRWFEVLIIDPEFPEISRFGSSSRCINFCTTISTSWTAIQKRYTGVLLYYYLIAKRTFMVVVLGSTNPRRGAFWMYQKPGIDVCYIFVSAMSMKCRGYPKCIANIIKMLRTISYSLLTRCDKIQFQLRSPFFSNHGRWLEVIGNTL